MAIARQMRTMNISRASPNYSNSPSNVTDEVMTDLASFLSQSEHLFAAGGAKSFLSAKLFETLMRKMGV